MWPLRILNLLRKELSIIQAPMAGPVFANLTVEIAAAPSRMT